MGYDLSNASGAYVRFTGSGWDLALSVAEHYGWSPAGALKPVTWNEATDGPWQGDYWLNVGQRVSADDAAALTAALDRAVCAPDFVEVAIRIVDEIHEELVEREPEWREDLEPLSRADAERFRPRLIEFAALTRQGAFIIE
jgi:hypothetical protein